MYKWGEGKSKVKSVNKRSNMAASTVYRQWFSDHHELPSLPTPHNSLTTIKHSQAEMQQWFVIGN